MLIYASTEHCWHYQIHQQKDILKLVYLQQQPSVIIDINKIHKHKKYAILQFIYLKVVWYNFYHICLIIIHVCTVDYHEADAHQITVLRPSNYVLPSH